MAITASQRRPVIILGGLILLTLVAVIAVQAQSEAKDPVPFTDVKAQTYQFIEWYDTIELTPEQDAIKKAALEPLPAPCCSNNTAYTCCCPCNMSRSLWGLTHYLITEHGYNAEQVQAKVKEWIATINPGGFSGDVCGTGGCNRPFEHNGCGGMRKGEVTWAG